ncbi:hypothetical protein NNJEOMEG_02786 [Fundidesulfovibrio magnetotacticus]|uniref:Uncharacterized protein n=1 Tax=Fundidesulfovibrio magnetotacticus TaxID=2730080 RepID=A0A6V8LXF3_9BACT|nr:DUF268 domain-containing protein [Fundidesulfovibrio magnetotacticus]GFK94938.1 hypothetical protein NNJEOMEG_02786 [Fundidesulfovibrio magnetotacticus]
MTHILHSLAAVPGRTVAIHGAGAYGVRVLADLRRERPDMEISCFLDSFKPSGEFEGLRLVNTGEATSGLLQGIDAVLVASANYEPIGQRLEALGCPRWFILMRSLEDEAVRRDKEVHEATRSLAGETEFHRYFHTLYLWRYRALCREHFGAPAPLPPLPREIPGELREAFAMHGRCEIVHGPVWDKRYPANYPLIYTDAEVDDCLRRIDEGDTSVYGQLDDWMREALERHPVAGAEVAVMGSLSPWYESFCLRHGARPVTMDYNAVVSRTPRIRTMTLAEASQGRALFDHAVSISSFEHDGLGAYGDPLDPDGDLKAMRAMKTLLRPGGLVFFNVPTAWDDMIHFNEYRVYGRHRLPLLLEGFEVLDSWGHDPARLRNAPREVFNPLFVLRNI